MVEIFIALRLLFNSTKKNIFLFSTLLLNMLLLSGCTTEVNIQSQLNTFQPILVTESKKNVLDGKLSLDRHVIDTHSTKYQKLMSWSSENTIGWEPTPGSYITNIDMYQDKFHMRFNLNGDFVVLSFIDGNGRPQQYGKSIEEGELDFLIE